MRVDIFITARMGSKRLPDKHFKKIHGNITAIEVLLNIVTTEFKEEIEFKKLSIYIVTGNYLSNERFCELKKKYPLQVFFGDDENIPLRHYDAAQTFNTDKIINIDGDDIFISAKALRTIFEKLAAGNEIVKTTGLPFGMNVFGYSRSMLAAVCNKKSGSKIDTGWGKLFECAGKSLEVNFDLPGSNLIRASLDYPKDLEFFRAVVSKKDETILVNHDELCSYILSEKYHNINNHLMDEYWDNFEQESRKQK